MRKTVAVAALAFAAAASVLPTAPANAYCHALLYEVTGRCTNPCMIAGQTYHRADDTALDLLPDLEWYCPA